MSPVSGQVPALWPYALELYARPGVEPLLLELQDAHGQCAPMLIWSLWMAARGRSLGSDLIGQAGELARAWEGVAVAPLRRIRRELKANPAAPHGRASERVRQGVKRLELESERMLLQMLEEIGDGAPARANARAALHGAVQVFGGAPAGLIDRLAELAA